LLRWLDEFPAHLRFTIEHLANIQSFYTVGKKISIVYSRNANNCVYVFTQATTTIIESFMIERRHIVIPFILRQAKVVALTEYCFCGISSTNSEDKSLLILTYSGMRFDKFRHRQRGSVHHIILLYFI